VDVRGIREVSLAEVSPTTKEAKTGFYLKTHRKEWERNFLFPPVKTAEGMITLCETDEGPVELRYRSSSLLPPILLFPSGETPSLTFKESSSLPLALLEVVPLPFSYEKPFPVELSLVGERVVEVTLKSPPFPLPKSRKVLALFGFFQRLPYPHHFSAVLSEIYEEKYEITLSKEVEANRRRLLHLEDLVAEARRLLSAGRRGLVPLEEVEKALRLLPRWFWQVLCVPGGFAVDGELDLREVKRKFLSLRERGAESNPSFKKGLEELRSAASSLPEEVLRLKRSEFPFAELNPTFREARLVRGRNFISYLWITAEKGECLELAVARSSLLSAAKTVGESLGKDLHSFHLSLVAVAPAGEVIV